MKVWWLWHRQTLCALYQKRLREESWWLNGHPTNPFIFFLLQKNGFVEGAAINILILLILNGQGEHMTSYYSRYQIATLNIIVLGSAWENLSHLRISTVLLSNWLVETEFGSKNSMVFRIKTYLSFTSYSLLVYSTTWLRHTIQLPQMAWV